VAVNHVRCLLNSNHHVRVFSHAIFAGTRARLWGYEQRATTPSPFPHSLISRLHLVAPPTHNQHSIPSHRCPTDATRLGVQPPCGQCAAKKSPFSTVAPPPPPLTHPLMPSITIQQPLQHPIAVCSPNDRLFRVQDCSGVVNRLQFPRPKTPGLAPTLRAQAARRCSKGGWRWWRT
jgi:hypothetical protein